MNSKNPSSKTYSDFLLPLLDCLYRIIFDTVKSLLVFPVLLSAIAATLQLLFESLIAFLQKLDLPKHILDTFFTFTLFLADKIVETLTFIVNLGDLFLECEFKNLAVLKELLVF